MDHPRVLIFGQTFNNFSGGGITLSNLFKGWPKDRLAVLSYPFMLHESSTELCNNFYQLGSEELTWKYPFSLIKQKFSSGEIEICETDTISVLRDTRNLKNLVSSNLLNPALRFTGLIHCVSSLKLSIRLKKWLYTFDPAFFYIQISNLESILFAQEIIDFLKIPSAIHMMDDWPSTLSSRGFSQKFWQKTIDKEFRKLLDKVTIHLSISDVMSEEYLARYGKVFKAFHNPVDISVYKNHKVYCRPNVRTKFSILYIGRVGVANRKSLLFFAKAIENGCLGSSKNIEFEIYSKDYEDEKLKSLREYNNVKLNPAVSHDDIPELFQHFDILLLPLDFSKKGLRFARFSMPTKASEYMMSGKPILIFAPGETAVSKFFSNNHCGYCIDEENGSMIDLAVKTLLDDSEYVRTITGNAYKIALEKFDGEKVRSEFHTLISQTTSTIMNNSSGK